MFSSAYNFVCVYQLQLPGQLVVTHLSQERPLVVRLAAISLSMVKVSQHELNTCLTTVVIWFAVISNFSVIELFTWHSMLIFSISDTSPQSLPFDTLLMV